PTRTRKSVVLPAPDGPSSPTTPGCTCIVRSVSAATVPYHLDTPRSHTGGFSPVDIALHCSPCASLRARLGGPLGCTALASLEIPRPTLVAHHRPCASLRARLGGSLRCTALASLEIPRPTLVAHHRPCASLRARLGGSLRCTALASLEIPRP